MQNAQYSMASAMESRGERADREATAAVLDRAGETRESVRKEFVGQIPGWYSPWLHLASTTGVAIALLALGAWGIHDVRGWELLLVPLIVVFANGWEWRVHKGVLHRRFPLFETLYEKHTPMHHRVYHEQDMAIRTARELRLVLIPALGVIGIVAALAPLSMLVALLLGRNAGFIVLVTCGVYMVSYELLHLSYHLPTDHPIGKLRLIRWLSRHHARHHDPRLMQRWNFNVTLPLFDWIYGTIHTKEREEKRAHAVRNASKIA